MALLIQTLRIKTGVWRLTPRSHGTERASANFRLNLKIRPRWEFEWVRPYLGVRPKAYLVRSKEKGLLMTKDKLKRRFVLIDDDEIFCAMMSNYAQLRDIPLDFFLSLGEMGSIGRLSDYELAIVDFDLGPMNGLEIAEYLPALFGDMPLILISATDRAFHAGKNWPASIKAFVHKERGPSAILDAAMSVASERSMVAAGA